MKIIKIYFFSLVIIIFSGCGTSSTLAPSASSNDLSSTTYTSEKGVVLMDINWGRTWKCGQYENAQLQALKFTKVDVATSEEQALDLRTPSKLFVDDKYLPYAYVLAPGEYVLAAFDVKVARSVTDIQHIVGNKENLFKESKPIGGSFTVAPNEIIYIGHFGLDCGAEPFLWRYYIEERNDFERYVSGFRNEYPFVKEIPVLYRLFSTEIFGRDYSLSDTTVK